MKHEMQTGKKKAMCAADGDVREARAHIPLRTKLPGDKPGCSTHKKGYGRLPRTVAPFLKARFTPVPAVDVDPLFTEQNYRYLHRTAENYARLTGKAFSVKYSPKDFETLMRRFEKAVTGKGVCLSCTEKHGRLRFRLEYKTWLGNLYFIPCRVLEVTMAPLRKITMEFFRHFYRRQHIEPFHASCEAEFMEQEIENCREWGGQPDEDLAARLKDYMEGDAARLFDEIGETPELTLREVSALIRKYNPGNERDKKLLETIGKGISLLREKKAFLMYLNYEEDQEYGAYPISPERLLRFVHRDDCIGQWMLEMINQESADGPVTFIMAGSAVLSPRTKRALRHDTFPERFMAWLEEFLEILYEYDSD